MPNSVVRRPWWRSTRRVLFYSDSDSSLCAAERVRGMGVGIQVRGFRILRDDL